MIGLEGKGMDDLTRIESFQDHITKYLLRHSSILDTTSKYQETNARVNRAIMKAVTECGCVEVHATKQHYATESTIDEMKEAMETHLSGKLCDHCEEIVMSEIGKNIFYLLSMMNQLHIEVEEVIKKENQKLTTLGIFNMS